MAASGSSGSDWATSRSSGVKERQRCLCLWTQTRLPSLLTSLGRLPGLLPRSMHTGSTLLVQTEVFFLFGR
jgi:hypothetical protein